MCELDVIGVFFGPSGEVQANPDILLRQCQVAKPHSEGVDIVLSLVRLRALIRKTDTSKREHRPAGCELVADLSLHHPSDFSLVTQGRNAAQLDEGFGVERYAPTRR